MRENLFYYVSIQETFNMNRTSEKNFIEKYEKKCLKITKSLPVTDLKNYHQKKNSMRKYSSSVKYHQLTEKQNRSCSPHEVTNKDNYQERYLIWISYFVCFTLILFPYSHILIYWHKRSLIETFQRIREKVL